MKLLKAIVRPDKVDQVKDALMAEGVSGMQIEVVVADHLAESVCTAIIEAARTGEIGDGRVFVLPIIESYKIRTGEMDHGV